ncbi:hypothetical protein B0T10DRAFT_541174 [Thelonectria olida]|uniref:BTB domain-containing protein n=1 Tax=Thelonectria olida TaxID=1576542 RepID=A0A9P8VTJ9_9HYPO|nr:hypothetical protein B0T10DRAFT_541174 [Thelonectria olida]
MGTHARVFDDKGDTIITLQTTRRDFYWCQDECGTASYSPTPEEMPKEIPPENLEAGHLGEPLEEGFELNNNARPQSITSSDIKAPDDGSTSLKDPTTLERPTKHGGRMEVQMRVSSRHLGLASPLFQKMFTGPFAEGTADDQGLYQIAATDWDPLGFAILLNIIHGHHRAVPRSLSLDMLAKIALIVDYYQCHEIVEIFADVWMNALGKEPTTYGLDSMLRLLTSWVFSQADTFQKMASLALRHSQGPIKTVNLPIPHDLLSKVESERQASLDDTFSTIYLLFDTLCYQSDCSLECSSLRLGYLTKELCKHNIFSPRATRPFIGYSIEGVKSMIKGFKSPRRSPLYVGRQSEKSCSCNIATKLAPALQRAEEGRLPVFSLGDYRVTTNSKRDELAIR